LLRYGLQFLQIHIAQNDLRARFGQSHAMIGTDQTCGARYDCRFS
jgi:hypothetical protein